MATDSSAYVDSGVSDSSKMEKLDLEKTRAMREQQGKMVAWTKQQFQQIKAARSSIERQWYLNLAFYFGKQNITLLPTQVTGSGLVTKFSVPAAPPWRARPVINRIRPTIRMELNQLTSQKPTATVIPASAEDRDMYAALAGEQIWDTIYREHKLKQTIRKGMLWTLTCGTGFIKTYWDYGKGKPKPVLDMLGQPLVDPKTGQPAMQPEGDICFSAETPFHVLVPDLREEELEDQPFVIHAQVKSPEWVQMKFPTAVDGTPVNPSSGSGEALDIMEDNFMSLMGTQSMNKQHSALVLEVWIKPGALPMAPEGMYFTIVGDKIVQAFQGWPFKHGEFPFAKMTHIPTNRFYGTSVIEDLMPLQKEYNRTRGQLIEAKNRMAKPQLIAPRGSVNPASITTEPGQVILYTPGFDPPQPIPLAPMPQYVLQELDRIQLDWGDIAGQHETSKGQVPPGVTAATAISFLNERDEAMMAHTFDSMEEGIEKIARHSLSLVNQFWDEERIVKVTSPDGSFDAMSFRGSDIDSGQDIRVEAGSALPVSKAAKQALITDWMKMGFIDPQDGLEVMDVGGINKIYDRIQVDQRQAQRENLKMSKVTEQMLQEHNQLNEQKIQADVEAQVSEGTPPEMINPFRLWNGNLPPILIPVNSWDNHALHIEYHNKYRKGQAFESLPQYCKDLFEMHVQMHVQAMGMETITMDPRLAAGLPPEEPTEEDMGQEGMMPPGPEAMPQEMNGGGGI